MAKKIYLIGGGDIKKQETKEIDKEVFSNLKNKKVYVINLTTNDVEKITKYKELWSSYLQGLGIKEFNFLSDSTSSEDIKEDISNAGLIYIIGGDTELLIENVKKMDLTPLIKSFEGVIVGNSAGAYLMCKKYTKIIDNKLKIFSGLDIVNLIMTAHYKDEFDFQFLELSKDMEFYAVPEKSVIMVDNKGKLNFIGDVYLFSKGKKTKTN